MLLVIPLADQGHYLTVEVHYDIIATGGPPDPPFDVQLTAVEFMGHHCIPERASVPEVFTMQTGQDGGEDFNDAIRHFTDSNRDWLLSQCRKFELDKGDSV